MVDANAQEVLHEHLLTSSCAYFAEAMIRGPLEEPYNGRFLIARHHLEWDRILLQHKKVSIQAARDHGKSYFWSMAFPIWLCGWRLPGSIGYLFGASQELAEEKLELIKIEIRQNQKLHWLIPESGERHWSKREIRLSTGSIIRARGWGVRVRGGHPQWIVADDVLDDQCLYSETVRKRAVEYFFSVPVNMVVPGGWLIVVGTPFHFADLYAKIAETKKYECSVFSALEDGHALFSQRYSADRLQDKREEIGEIRFAREFLCRPLSDEASLFPSHLFEGDKIRLPYKLGLPWQYWEERGMQRYTGVDLAFSAEIGADFTVIVTLAVDEQGNRWLANIRRGQGWGYDRQIQEMKEEYALMRSDVFHIEANQAQRILGDAIAAQSIIPVRLFFTAGAQPKKPWTRGMTSIVAGKHSLDRGVPSMRLELERGKWRIPRGDPYAIEMTDIWMGEFQCISYEDNKVASVGEHDDMVMATWMADTAAKLGHGVSMRFAGGDEDLEEEDGSDEWEGEDLDFFGIGEDNGAESGYSMSKLLSGDET